MQKITLGFRPIAPVALAASVLLALAACSSKEPSLALHWKAWANTQADTLVSNAEQMLAASVQYCANTEGPNDAGLNLAKTSFTQLLTHWGYTNGYPYKAIDEQALSFSLYFWPDKRNMTEVRLQARVDPQQATQEAEQAIQEAEYSQLIAAEKGIPAMEWLLFKEELSHTQRCNALVAVSDIYLSDIQSLRDYHQTAPLVLEEWTGNSDIIAGRSIALNLLYSQISRLESHLRQSRDAESGEWISYLAEGWRSENTWPLYHQSVTSLQEMLEHTGETSTISADNKTRLSEFVHRAALIKQRLSRLEGHSQDPELLDELQQLLAELANFLETNLAENFGILIGFNNFDGD